MRQNISRRTVLRSGIAAGLVAVAGTGHAQAQDSEPSPAEWPQYGRDSGNTGANPDASGPSGDSQPTALWSHPIAADQPLSSPIVTGNNAIFTTGSLVVAVNIETGAVSWEYEAESPLYGPPATVATDFIGNEVYVGTATGAVVAISTATGNELWRHETKNSSLTRSAPLVARGEQLYVTGRTTLSAVSSTEQQRQWSLSQGATTTPAVGTQSVWSGTTAGIVGLSSKWDQQDRKSGSVFQQEMGSQYLTQDARGAWSEQKTPTVANGQVFVPSAGVTSINTETGVINWHFDDESMVTASPAVTDGTVYFASGTEITDIPESRAANAGTVYAVPVDQPEAEITQIRTELRDKRTELAALLDDSGGVQSIEDNPEAEQLREEIQELEQRLREQRTIGREAAAWTADVDGPVNTALAVTSDTVYVTTDSGTVYALDTSNGTEQWQYSLFEQGSKRAAVSDPVVAGDRLYVASRETGLVALGASSGTGTDGGDGSDDDETDPSQDNSDDSQSSDDGDSGTSEPTESTSSDDGDSESSDGSGPGFGLPAGLAALGGAGYLLNRRSGDLSEDVEKGE
ncbi:outer membrane protein assembly factor BamB family protein [Halovenus halobia]|uniref:outer membrane protein assembly factor BamB family protein n=1 Tax=Halovenus halobia TaxID=3396622 RepID=UPI003F549CFD